MADENGQRPTVEGAEMYFLVLYRGRGASLNIHDGTPLSVTTLGALPHDYDAIRARFADAAETFIDRWYAASTPPTVGRAPENAADDSPQDASGPKETGV